MKQKRLRINFFDYVHRNTIKKHLIIKASNLLKQPREF